MKRVIPAVVLVLASCVAEPPERTPLPDVAEVLPEPAGCLLSIGDPNGVVIEDVVPGSAADGVLESGDVVVAIDGVPTPDTTHLIDMMAERAPADTVEVTYERDGTEQRALLTLGTNPDDPERPQIGVMIQTTFETVDADTATGPIEASPTSRPIAIGNRIFIYEPAGGSWASTPVEIPDGADWVATTESIYAVEVGAAGLTFTDLAGGEPVPHDGFEGWSGLAVVGSVGDKLILSVTSPVADQPGFVTVGTSLFDPETGTTVWAEPLLDGFGIPFLASGSPDGSLFVIAGADEEDGSQISVDVFDVNGTRVPAQGIDGLGSPIGWFDATTAAFMTTEQQISLYSFLDGFLETYDIDEGLAGLQTHAVGDSNRILVVDGRSLLMQDLIEDGEVLTIAHNCSIGAVGSPGLGSSS